MDESHRTLLKGNTETLVDDVDPKDLHPHLLQHLESFSHDDVERIEAETTRRDKARKLLEILPRKGPKAFQVFKEALSKKQPHLHQLLMEQGDVSDKASACDLPASLDGSDDHKLKSKSTVDGVGNSHLHVACASGNTPIVKFLLTRKTDVDKKNNFGLSPLQLTLLNWKGQQRENIMDLLIEAGAEIDLVEKDGDTALHIATKKGNVWAVKKLLNHSADPNKKNNRGYTSFHCACMYGQDQAILSEMRDLLIDHGADVDVYLGDGSGNSPLHVACAGGNVSMAKFLLEKGADINKRSQYGNSPLALALMNVNDKEVLDEIVDLLIESGADVNIADEEGDTPLHNATMRGNTSITKKLLSKKADPNKTNKKGYTALQIAFVNKTMDQEALEEIADLLIECSADVTIADEDGDTPLHFASLRGNISVMKKLLNRKADPNHKNKKGYPTLHFVCLCEQDENTVSEMRKLLIDFGADVSAYRGDENGNSPLHVACASGNISMAKFFFENNADNNRRSNYGNTPLKLAIMNVEDQKRLESIVDLLIEHDADVNIADDEGVTPLHTASAKNNVCIVKKLLTNKANPNKRDNKGASALHYAFAKRIGKEELQKVSELLAENPSRAEFAGDIKRLFSQIADPKKMDNSETSTCSTSDKDMRQEKLKEIVGLLGDNPISTALMEIFEGNMKNLFSHIADRTKGDDSQTSTRHSASVDDMEEEAFKEIVGLLIECGADVNIADEDGDTPLHIATMKGKTSIMKILLSKQADPNKKNNKGFTAFHIACLHGTNAIIMSEMAELLIGYGADVDIDLGDESGNSPLHVACAGGNVHMAKFLLEKGANVDKRSNYGHCPLVLAMINVNDQDTLEGIVGLLIEYGADVNIPDEDGDTPLHIATMKGKTGVIRKLLRGKADPNKKNKKGCNALLIAFRAVGLDQEKLEKIVGLLIEGGADVNIADEDGVTPLHIATNKGMTHSVKQLLRGRADPNKKNKKGYTALLSAFANDHIDQDTLEEIFGLLIECGADVNIADEDGDTPLHIATMKGKTGVIRKLLYEKADPNKKNKMGYNPFHYVCAYVEDHKTATEMADIFVEHKADIDN